MVKQDTKTHENVALTTLGSDEPSIQEELGDLIGLPDRSQKVILAGLARLYLSLSGPENLLDKVNYSRPFPTHRRINKK